MISKFIKIRLIRGSLGLSLGLGSGVVAVAAAEGEAPVPTVVAPAARPLVVQLTLGSLAGAVDQTVQLAEAMPEGLYAWAPPGGDALPVAGLLERMAAANFYLGQLLGGTLPAEVKTTGPGVGGGKAELIKHYQVSVAFAQMAIGALDEKALAEPVEMMGRPVSRAQVLMVLLDHAQQHLGQLIAYGRMNRIAPPWLAEAK